MNNEQYWDCDQCQERYPYNTGCWDPIEVESWTVAVVDPSGGCHRAALREVEWLCGDCAKERGA